MKYFIAALVLTFSMSLAAPADAGIFFNRKPRVSKYQSFHLGKYPRFWSPGIMLPWFTQGNGGPRMVWRGDWVIR